jgi:hypothetical protein
MSIKGGSKPGERRGGRKVGSKNKALLERESAIAAAVEAVGGAPIRAQAGISPKELLLHAMREAWNEHYALREEIAPLRVELAALPPEIEGEPNPAFKQAKDRLDAMISRHRASLASAVAIAEKVSPYEHAKLAQIDGKVAGNVRITVRQF